MKKDLKKKRKYASPKATPLADEMLRSVPERYTAGARSGGQSGPLPAFV